MSLSEDIYDEDYYSYDDYDDYRPELPDGIEFKKSTRQYKKYMAILPDGKRVHFGDVRYQQYKDSVPKNLGGGLYSDLDHYDLKRRDNYRKRHGGKICKNGQRCIDNLYTPAWFSYYYLW